MVIFFMCCETKIFILAEMSYEDRAAVLDMDHAMSLPDEHGADIFDAPPPGDEGFDISHAGGEHEVFNGLAQDIENMCGTYVFWYLSITK